LNFAEQEGGREGLWPQTNQSFLEVCVERGHFQAPIMCLKEAGSEVLCLDGFYSSSLQESPSPYIPGGIWYLAERESKGSGRGRGTSRLLTECGAQCGA